MRDADCRSQMDTALYSPAVELNALGRSIADTELEFTARYMAASNVNSLLKSHPELAGPDTISALESLLKDPGPCAESRGLFLYKQAAEALLNIVLHDQNAFVSNQALFTLKEALVDSTGARHRAVTEAIGSLPLVIKGPSLPALSSRQFPKTTLKAILCPFGIGSHKLRWIGRSLVIESPHLQDKIMVIKTASKNDSAQSLQNEIIWQEYLRENLSTPVRFEIPEPVKVEGARVFKLIDAPVTSHSSPGISKGKKSICFIAPREYFSYINEPLSEKGFTVENFREAISQNAWLLGHLASAGIIHTAPIPLFHNRVQQDRRTDGGLYEWWRGGRLDRWLDSCLYPNIGPTGLRDFEHIISFKGPTWKLYRHIGTHILSLLLVSGSYFRNLNPAARGLDRGGRPVDARHLFPPKAFEEIVQDIFCSYFHGFTGSRLTDKLPFDLKGLVSRMIEEMGVDNYMEEILRTADQARMNEDEFKSFLTERGYSEKEILSLKKGHKELVLLTGPHLGEFNQRIFIPEMIEATGSVAALCIAEKWNDAATPLQFAKMIKIG